MVTAFPDLASCVAAVLDSGIFFSDLVRVGAPTDQNWADRKLALFHCAGRTPEGEVGGSLGYSQRRHGYATILHLLVGEYWDANKQKQTNKHLHTHWFFEDLLQDILYFSIINFMSIIIKFSGSVMFAYYRSRPSSVKTLCPRFGWSTRLWSTSLLKWNSLQVSSAVGFLAKMMSCCALQSLNSVLLLFISMVFLAC